MSIHWWHVKDALFAWPYRLSRGKFLRTYRDDTHDSRAPILKRRRNPWRTTRTGQYYAVETTTTPRITATKWIIDPDATAFIGPLNYGAEAEALQYIPLLTSTNGKPVDTIADWRWPIHAYSGREYLADVTHLRPFFYDPKVTTPLNVAARDTKEYVVMRIFLHDFLIPITNGG